MTYNPSFKQLRATPPLKLPVQETFNEKLDFIILVDYKSGKLIKIKANLVLGENNDDLTIGDIDGLQKIINDFNYKFEHYGLHQVLKNDNTAYGQVLRMFNMFDTINMQAGGTYFSNTRNHWRSTISNRRFAVHHHNDKSRRASINSFMEFQFEKDYESVSNRSSLSIYADGFKKGVHTKIKARITGKNEDIAYLSDLENLGISPVENKPFDLMTTPDITPSPDTVLKGYIENNTLHLKCANLNTTSDPIYVGLIPPEIFTPTSDIHFQASLNVTGEWYVINVIISTDGMITGYSYFPDEPKTLFFDFSFNMNFH